MDQSTYLVLFNSLKKLKDKTYLIGGSSAAAYACFYGREMISAEKYAQESKELIDGLVKDIDDIILTIHKNHE